MDRNSGRSGIQLVSIVAAFLLAGAIFGLGYLLFKIAIPRESAPAEKPPVYQVTLIPAPTHTPTAYLPTEVPTATPSVSILPEGVLGIGAYVKVTGTQGLGLRMRADAGTDAAINFLAMDEEVFKVIGGPLVNGDYTWWQLEAPYDATRAGWAAETFLEVIVLATPTAQP